MNYLSAVANDIRHLIPQELLPTDADALLLIYAVLARVKGQGTDAEDVHDAWTAWMLMRGEDHPSMCPYEDLPDAVRREDEPFVVAIRAACGSRAD